MPKVPTYDNFQTSVSGQPNVQFQTPGGPNPGGIAAEQASQFGQAATNAGAALAKIVRVEQAKADEDRVNDVMNQLVKSRTDLQVESMSLTGRAALERPDGKSLQDEYTEKLDKVRQELAEKLGNNNQRQVFNHQAGQLNNQFRGALGAHTLQQAKRFRADGQSATVEEAQRQGGLLWGDEAVRAQSSDVIRGVVEQIKLDNGWDATKDKALIDATLTKFMSPLHASVMSGMLDAGQVDAARDYYKTNSVELTTQARLQLHDAINVGDFEKRTQEGTEQILAQAGGDTQKALALAREKYSGKEEDGIVARLKTLDAEKTTIDAHDASRVSKAAWSSVMESGKIAPTLLAELRQKAPGEERRIRDWQETKWRRAKADAEGAKTDGFDVYYGLRQMSVNDPAAFSQLDLRKSAPLLGKAQLNHLVEVQAGISKGDAKAMETQRVVKSTLGLIKSEVAAVGIDLSPKEGTPAAVESNKFMGALTMALDTATKTKGSPLTTDEARRIGLSMVREGVEQNSGVFGMFQTRKRGYQIATDPGIAPGASYVDRRFGDIPDDVRKALVNDYRAKYSLGAGVLTSQQEADIERAYTRGVQQGRFK